MDENRTRSAATEISHPGDDRTDASCTKVSRTDPLWPDGIPLEVLCQDDSWLEAFIRDTEENQMLHAPARLRANTLSKVQKLRFSKRVQLISYSLKVCTAAAAALFILYTTPVFLQPSAYPGVLTKAPGGTGGRVHSQMDGRSGGKADHPADGVIGEGMAWTRQTLQEGFQQITGSIYDLSNELFPGR